LRGVHPAIDADSILLLWAGGLWDWFDPLLIIRATAALQEQLPRLRLCFFGGARPNPYGEPYRTRNYELARGLAAELGALDRSVIFLEEWVPYEARGSYLAEADAGVSAHVAGVETHFAFRTRLLDYLWARLPVVCSADDSLGEELAQHGAGLLVGVGDLEGWIAALRRIHDDAELRAQCRAAADQLAAKYVWPRVAQPLAAFCRAARPAPDRAQMLDLCQGDTPPTGLAQNRSASLERIREQEQLLAHLTREIERKNQHILELESLIGRIQDGRLMRVLRRLGRVTR
jgi:glycosyltransferase involved in cell wall biosynthesis